LKLNLGKYWLKLDRYQVTPPMKYDTLRHKTVYNDKKYFEKNNLKKYFEKQNIFFVHVCFQRVARLLVRDNQAILEKKWDRKRTFQANV
jgi:hypothetical protein